MKNFLCLSGIVAVLILLANLAACSSIKHYFPDKQKDYRYTAEISALNLPADLGDNAIEHEQQLAEPAEKGEPTGPERLQSRIGERRGRVELVGYGGGAARLLISEPFMRSWFIVGKALSRSALEVTQRNKEEGAYSVRFDPAAKQIKDGSLWNEFEFFFGEELHQDEEYQIRLAENGEHNTEVIVMDTAGKPLSKGPGLSLLMLLFTAIKTDIAQ